MIFPIRNIIIHRQLYRLLAHSSERSSRYIRKSFFILLMCLIPSSTYSMLEQDIPEEEHKKSIMANEYRETELATKESKSKKTHILFLCTGNSCRSQMAEGWTRYLGSDVAEVNSAGLKAQGLNPNAVKVMKESGVDITSQTSKVVVSGIIQWADLVVTVCGDADEHCPTLPTKTKKIHWPVKDPAKATGTEEEVIKEFQTVRDEIRERVFELLNGFREKF